MEEKTLVEQTTSLTTVSEELLIMSAEGNEEANNILKMVMSGKKEIKTYWKDPIEKANQAHKALTAKRNEMLNPLEIAEKLVKGKISEWITEENKRKAEEERERQEEEKRKDDELAKKEQELKEAEGFLTPEQLAEEQKKIENEKKREEILKNNKVEITEAVPKGQIVKKHYSAEVIDFALLPDKYKIADMQMLNSIAKATKENTSIPGVKINVENRVQTRI